MVLTIELQEHLITAVQAEVILVVHPADLPVVHQVVMLEEIVVEQKVLAAVQVHQEQQEIIKL